MKSTWPVDARSGNLRGIVSKTGDKIGRNELCPCGSGRKYKKCCLMKKEAAPMQSQDPQQTTVPPISANLSVPSFPGEAAVVTIVPTFAPGDPRNTNDPHGQPGKYRVTVVLSRPGRFELEERTLKFLDLLAGDSHTAIKAVLTGSGGGESIFGTTE